jgi:methionine synthase II (cobalamin-independent)
MFTAMNRFKVIQEECRAFKDAWIARRQLHQCVWRSFDRTREAAGAVTFWAASAISQRVLKIVSQMPGEPKPSLKLTLLRR